MKSGRIKIYDSKDHCLATSMYLSNEGRLKTIEGWEIFFPEAKYISIFPDAIVDLEDNTPNVIEHKKETYRLKKKDRLQPINFTRPKAQYDNTTPYNIANEYR